MDLAYVKHGDSSEELAALAELTYKLSLLDITVVASKEHYSKLPQLQKGPFLHFSNPYIRMNKLEHTILELHKKSPFAFIKVKEGQVVSINPLNIDANQYSFILPNKIFELDPAAFKTALPKRKHALMAMIKDGTPYFDVWCNYYKKYFDPQDVYLICCQSSAESLSQFGALGYQILPTEVSVYDMHNKLSLINSYQRELLHRYETVIYADIDEIIFHPHGLDHVLNNPIADITRCEGYDLTHVRQHESNNLDVSQPIKHQRRFWVKSFMYDKPTIVRKYHPWSTGLHELQKGPGVDWRTMCSARQGLFLIHLRNADYKIASDLNKKNVDKQISVVGGGEQCLYLDKELSDWWSTFERQAHPIPEHIKNSFNF